MSIAINQIVNANVYINGNSLMGKAQEFKIPDIEFESIEHKGLGLVGTIKLPAGINAIEGSVTWDSYYPEVRAEMYNPFKNIQLMCRSNLQVFNSQGLAAEEPMTTIMNVSSAKVGGTGHKNKENSAYEDTFNVHSIKQMVAGKEILFFDAFANIFRVNGEDVLVKYRTNIGQ
ncbi:phage major tail tube protein [Actinobacillus equuli]|uniref:phage major tail tube protein n=1 Tax=Actinobacillus equuli TaxID=718 RepID=UPI00241895BF|nr:phage major tail tube protein [Actinobacillus equuli]MDG4947399.1 phage major tail tube protein [Actinobacillus equuli subsp. haemolyticus]MDG4949253.1 phage major tail tube protein [Actinobacillus equuli subsp. haemolyticus]WGE52377.1 phage major tail tube protein [Actinobacillus equuli subsp. haemolyticus]